MAIMFFWLWHYTLKHLVAFWIQVDCIPVLELCSMQEPTALGTQLAPNPPFIAGQVLFWLHSMLGRGQQASLNVQQTSTLKFSMFTQTLIASFMRWSLYSAVLKHMYCWSCLYTVLPLHTSQVDPDMRLVFFAPHLPPHYNGNCYSETFLH